MLVNGEVRALARAWRGESPMKAIFGRFGRRTPDIFGYSLNVELQHSGRMRCGSHEWKVSTSCDGYPGKKDVEGRKRDSRPSREKEILEKVRCDLKRLLNFSIFYLIANAEEAKACGHHPHSIGLCDAFVECRISSAKYRAHSLSDLTCSLPS